MSENINNLLIKLNINNKDSNYLWKIVTVLSFVVILTVFWSLKLTGIGVAGEAFCGKPEHVHKESCFDEADPCRIEEHIHTENCYSDIKADIETSDDWEDSLADLVRGPTIKDNVVLVARSQIGYTESELNFQVDNTGVRRGITRYGQWYGNPYGDWSAMFVSFCLNYAGADHLPTNSGPEAMRLGWEKEGLYKDASDSPPEIGNLVFLRKDADSVSANNVAVITAVDEVSITFVIGDWNNTVTELQFAKNNVTIMGYGQTPSEQLKLMLAAAPKAASYTIWLDGTDGGLGHLTGSPDTAYTVQDGSVIRLPDAWTSPSKYSYKLRGWYDITNARYYAAGAEMTVKGNAVLYADWVASTYDIGVFNAQVADTVSTNSFITTHMFDYNYLLNIHSSKVQSTIRASEHSETWSMVTSGKVAYGNRDTMDFIFVDNDSGGLLCIPNNRDSHNVYPGAGIVTPGIYSDEIGELLFSTDNLIDPTTGEGIIGKNYLGTGDHLFQIMDNPNDEHYGYYYYDSKHNAASYNQTNKRFYVYEYLEGTSDAMGSTYSDFLPLNSPYANTNGKTLGRFNYDGVDKEYVGVSHYRYDSKYNSGNYNSANNVQTDYAYGMRSDIKFYLPNDPGSGGNKDLYGNDMHFQFSGDDDLWVLIDGQLVLDIGGIHGAEEGVIDFSTGEVTVQGKKQASLMDLGITDGDHTMSILYLERGSSLSNCSIYFNLAPRFGLQIQKEDVLTQELLDGTEFTVYEDFECTKPAELWESEEAYNQDIADDVLDRFKSSFTVKNGIVSLWGLGSGNTYYIKETSPPAKNGYGLPEGLIKLTIEREGQATYLVEVIPDADGNGPSNGFTVHGVKIDEETQRVYITITNAPETVIETTTVQVIKKWEDKADHSNDYIQAYLTVTDPDGTVRRIREVTISNENDWSYIWTNLPKYNYDNLTEVQYGIQESYESGYYSTVRKITQIEISKTEWAEATSFKNGEQYILRGTGGYLSTVSASDAKLTWVNEETAKNSELATWKATVSGGNIKFTNGAGYILTFNYNSRASSQYYYATKSSSTYQSFTPVDTGSGFRFYATRSNRNYYMGALNTSTGRTSVSTSSSSGIVLVPMKQVTQTEIHEVEDWAYQITNTPLSSDNETSMTVKKEWIIPQGFDSAMYQEFAVTVRLYANGVNTGRSVTLTLKNNWQETFLGLPYKDDAGKVIQYTIVEVWDQPRWSTQYGEIKESNSYPPTYSTVLTNTYYTGGPILPTTGSFARPMYMLCGCTIMLGSLVYGIGSRRKKERRVD